MSSTALRVRIHEPVTIADLPDETLVYLLTRFLEPWKDGLWAVDKRWLHILQAYVPRVRYKPPRLPCTVHLELDVRSSDRVVSRWIYTMNQHLWELPMNVSRFEWIPGQFCKAKEDWYVKESWKVWKLITKSMKLNAQPTMSNEYPNYCEFKQYHGELLKGYISQSMTEEFMYISRKLSSTPKTQGEDGSTMSGETCASPSTRGTASATDEQSPIQMEVVS